MAAEKTLKVDSTDDCVVKYKETANDSDPCNNAVQRNMFSSQELNARSELLLCSKHSCPADEDTADAGGTEMTDDSQPVERRFYCDACCGADYVNSALTSSVPVSSDEASRFGRYDSVSDTPITARFSVTSSGTKLKTRRMRPTTCYTTDSDLSITSGNIIISMKFLLFFHYFSF